MILVDYLRVCDTSRKIVHGLICIAPAPLLAGLDRPDDFVVRRMGVFGSMPVFG